ncbi:MAG: SH3 domain-containing protein [Nitrospira sp.]|nr:SH3 domain-containing protein [Candidatus Brocadiales bacterium]MBL7048359.1 SH3 domain-containing protein [Nitrospira sp.]
MKKVVMFAGLFVFMMILSSQASALCVDISEANLRKGPGTKYEKSWEVFKYMPFEKVSKKGNWYKVKDVDGDTHWIYEKIVTTKYQCAVVKVDKANIRKGPGTNFKKKASSPAFKYDAYRVDKIQLPWVKITDEFGDTGWIYRTLVWIQ